MTKSCSSNSWFKKRRNTAKSPRFSPPTLGYGQLGGLSGEQRDDLEQEVEDAIEEWDVAETEDEPPADKTLLQKLLKEHYEICEQIMDIRDSKLSDDDEGAV